MVYRWFLFTLVLALAALGSIAPARAQGGEVETVTAAFKQAFIAGDGDAVAELFADDGVLIGPDGVVQGRAAVRAFVETFITDHPGLSVSFSETEVSPDTAVHRMFVASDPVREAGASRIVQVQTFVVSDGQISSLIAEYDLADPETERLTERVRGSRPDVFKTWRCTADGRPNFSFRVVREAEFGPGHSWVDLASGRSAYASVSVVLSQLYLQAGPEGSRTPFRNFEMLTTMDDQLYLLEWRLTAAGQARYVCV